jgi:hypothetical protein
MDSVENLYSTCTKKILTLYGSIAFPTDCYCIMEYGSFLFIKKHKDKSIHAKYKSASKTFLKRVFLFMRHSTRTCVQSVSRCANNTIKAQFKQQIQAKKSVLRIHDILVWIRIRIRGSMPLTNGSGFASGSCYFHHRPSRRQQKTNFFKTVFCILLIEGTFS